MHFQFDPGWYRQKAVAPLVLAYYVVLRSVLRMKPWLRKCLAHCRHCGIFFLADPRNAGRRDLGCPFGCSQAHRRRESIRRSTEYYQGDQGRIYKSRQYQRQQEKRRLAAAAGKPPEGNGLDCPAQSSLSCESKGADPSPAPLIAPSPRNDPESFQPPPEHFLRYLVVVVSLIEERPISREEILEMLQKVFRQRSMCRRRRIDQGVAWLNEQPP